jgi:hypothetical protein
VRSSRRQFTNRRTVSILFIDIFTYISFVFFLDHSARAVYYQRADHKETAPSQLGSRVVRVVRATSERVPRPSLIRFARTFASRRRRLHLPRARSDRRRTVRATHPPGFYAEQSRIVIIS